MNCPNCEMEMDRDDHFEKFDDKGQGLPSADYLCPECGLEAQWVKGQPGIRILFDPRNGVDKDFTGILDYRASHGPQHGAVYGDPG